MKEVRQYWESGVIVNAEDYEALKPVARLIEAGGSPGKVAEAWRLFLITFTKYNGYQP